IAGQLIEALGRRGKYILFGLGNPTRPFGPTSPRGAEELLLVIHLGMSGQLRIVEPAKEIANHTHVIFDLDDGKQLRYRDVRRFGRLLLGTESELLESGTLPKLGPEPIEPGFDSAELYRRFRNRRGPLKAVLLDQSTVAGVGNIYADESLYRARLRPDRAARSLSRKSVDRLQEAMRESLLVAIKNRGSSVDTYRDAWGESGTQQEELLVYGRAGEPCFNCGRPLASVRIAGRTTVFCRRCQH